MPWIPAASTARNFSFSSTASEVLEGVDVKGKLALVTGGSLGIGLETCRQLAKAGAEVVLASRNLDQLNAAAELIRKETPDAPDPKILYLDLGDLEQVTEAAATFIKEHLPPGRNLDILLCNAGIMALPKLERTKQGIEQQSAINWIGHAHLVNMLLPRMKQQTTPSRIVIVSSSAHMIPGGLDLNDLNWERRRYSAWGAYGASKAANILHGKHLAKMLAGTPIRVFSLNPGNINTDLGRYIGFSYRVFHFACKYLLPRPHKQKTVPQGAATQTWACTAPELESFTGGEFLQDCNVTACSKTCADLALAEQLWEKGEAMIQAALTK